MDTSFLPPSPFNPESRLQLLADVVVPRRLRKAFTYKVPPHLEGILQVGSLVWVPFGTQRLQGMVVSLKEHPDLQDPREPFDGKSLRSILGLLDIETADKEHRAPQWLPLAQFLADYYLAPIGQYVKLVTPPEKPVRRSVRYRITEQGLQVVQENKRLSFRARDLLNRLARTPKGLTLTTLQQSFKGRLSQHVTRLQAKGWIQQEFRDPRSTGLRKKRNISNDGPSGISAIEISEEKIPRPAGSFSEDLKTALDTSRFTPLLVTASAQARLGYILQAVALSLSRHRGVLVVTGESHRAARIGKVLRVRWGHRVELVQGRRSQETRRRVWDRIREGEAQVVVGTRTTVFAPIDPLGLICIDSEEETSLKDEQSPPFHAREVAWERARRTGAVLLLCSSHPSLETVHRMAQWKGPGFRYQVTSDHPRIRMEDLRRVPYGTLFSDNMKTEMSKAVQSGVGVILYHNRKGFAPSLLCRDCGAVPRCIPCKVSLTYYRRTQQLKCPYCGMSFPIPDQCLSCAAVRLEPVGFGTESLEEATRRMFPRARVARLDRDCSPRLEQADMIRREMWRGNIDILIGTQMLCQGGPLPPVGFVGIPYADAGLHVPDFRAAERTYHSLMDIVEATKPDRAGGVVMVQTYMREHPVMQAVLHQKSELFYDQELRIRSGLLYPPWSTLIYLEVSGKDADTVQEGAAVWKDLLVQGQKNVEYPVNSPEGLQRFLPDRGEDEAVTIMGPVPAGRTKSIRNNGLQLLVKSRHHDLVRKVVQRSLEILERDRRWNSLKFSVDVDPLETG